VSITRSGTLAVYRTPAAACTPSSSPRFHHDNWNSGYYQTDAITPGRPYGVTLAGDALGFSAPGGDGLCGTASQYQLVTSDQPITPENFASARPLTGAPAPGAAGSHQALNVPDGAGRYVALRAVDAAGNVGLPAVWDLGRGFKRTRRAR
jgi:hypothetical protein